MLPFTCTVETGNKMLVCLFFFLLLLIIVQKGDSDWKRQSHTSLPLSFERVKSVKLWHSLCFIFRWWVSWEAGEAYMKYFYWSVVAQMKLSCPRMAVDLEYEPAYRSELMPDLWVSVAWWLSLTLSLNQSHLFTKAIKEWCTAWLQNGLFKEVNCEGRTHEFWSQGLGEHPW